MASGEAAAGADRGERGRPEFAWERPRPLRAGELAWLGLLPCAALVVAAVVVLGPPLGRLAPQSHAAFWPSLAERVKPEPTEQARFLIALAGPLLLSGFVALGRRRRWTLPSSRTAALATSAQLAGLGFVAACYVVQRRHVFDLAVYTGSPHAAGGRKVFVLLGEEWPEVPDALRARGYVLAARERLGMAEFAATS